MRPGRFRASCDEILMAEIGPNASGGTENPLGKTETGTRKVTSRPTAPNQSVMAAPTRQRRRNLHGFRLYMTLVSCKGNGVLLCMTVGMCIAKAVLLCTSGEICIKNGVLLYISLTICKFFVINQQIYKFFVYVIIYTANPKLV